MSPKVPRLKKGEIVDCPKCGNRLFTIARDCFSGERISEDMFEGGQNFRAYDPMACKKCGGSLIDLFVSGIDSFRAHAKVRTP